MGDHSFLPYLLSLSLASFLIPLMPCCHQANAVSQPRQALWLAVKEISQSDFYYSESAMDKGLALSPEGSEMQLQRLCQDLNISPQGSFP